MDEIKTPCLCEAERYGKKYWETGNELDLLVCKEWMQKGIDNCEQWLDLYCHSYCNDDTFSWPVQFYYPATLLHSKRLEIFYSNDAEDQKSFHLLCKFLNELKYYEKHEIHTLCISFPTRVTVMKIDDLQKILMLFSAGKFRLFMCPSLVKLEIPNGNGYKVPTFPFVKEFSTYGMPCCMGDLQTLFPNLETHPYLGAVTEQKDCYARCFETFSKITICVDYAWLSQENFQYAQNLETLDMGRVWNPCIKQLPRLLLSCMPNLKRLLVNNISYNLSFKILSAIVKTDRSLCFLDIFHTAQDEEEELKSSKKQEEKKQKWLSVFLKLDKVNEISITGFTLANEEFYHILHHPPASLQHFWWNDTNTYKNISSLPKCHVQFLQISLETHTERFEERVLEWDTTKNRNYLKQWQEIVFLIAWYRANAKSCPSLVHSILQFLRPSFRHLLD